MNALRRVSLAAGVALLLALAPGPAGAAQTLEPIVPFLNRGNSDFERFGTHDANNLRTVFWNFGMVGDYPADPVNVDLSVFHSVEVPKGSGMNYSDGITPFVLTRFRQANAIDTTAYSYIMETGFRERQGDSPQFHRVMRFEPRPGFFQVDADTNRGRSPAMSHDPRTWPSRWPDKENDPDDQGWAGKWNGYFGKRPAADQESFTVMDDQYYDAWYYFPDSRDSSRYGLGLRVEVRGFQWANPQAGNVIFWHYDIINEGTTDHNDMIFGLYMDSGVGGSALSCDGIYESDDDNAFFDRSSGLNLVYTYDTYGHGRDLSGSCAKTGFLGYSYLETPGNALNGVDDDNDGKIDERRDGGPGLVPIVSQADIRTYFAANYDTTKFIAFYGPLDKRPAYRAGRLWPGDEDMDWNAETDDVGADGVEDTHDTGEGDGIPTDGEPNFDKTDVNESDQIGLTGFKMNRIRAGAGNPGGTDGIVFYTDDQNWPERLYEKFTDPFVPARFDSAVAANYNIGFLFASGPFTLRAGQHERFSLALAYGATLPELRANVQTVQQIYNANYQFAVPPTQPTVVAETGDRRVRLTWDDVAERSVDPVTHERDFEGYRIYRATDPEFRDSRVVTNGQGTDFLGNGLPIAQFDLVDNKLGFSRLAVSGVQYWLGTDSGIRHTWVDSTVTNGQQYYYAVCAYDQGFDPGVDSLAFYPSENAIAASRTPRGGLILPSNLVAVRPNPKVAGWRPASVSVVTHAVGTGHGTVNLEVVNSNVVPEGHLFAVTFAADSPDSIRAMSYTLTDSTDHKVLFRTGTDLLAEGIGAAGSGLLPLIQLPLVTTVDSVATGFAPGSPTNTRLSVSYSPVLSPNLRRPGYPDDITIVFDNVVRDTSTRFGADIPRAAKFRVIAHTAAGDLPLKFRFRDRDADSTLSRADEYIETLSFAYFDTATAQPTWRFVLDTLGQGARGPIQPPRLGDVFDLKLKRPVGAGEVFTFTSGAQRVDGAKARADFAEKTYVVPNPYLGSASFEPERFAISGRGERRVEFRAVPTGAVIRIYTVHGDLVQVLKQDGSVNGFVAWNLRSKDNLDVAPGLYVFHVDAPGLGTSIGKFAIIK